MSHYRRSRTEGATYFFTLTLADRSSQLLTMEIERLRHAYRLAQARRPFQTIAICVLPDHLHAVWRLPERDADFGLRWGLIKRAFSTGLLASTARSESKLKKREKGIWQRRFWEHQIRNDSDLERHVNYVHYNPVKHGLVERVRDWPYSSFHRYVETGLVDVDWGAVSNVDAGEFGEA